MGNNINTINVNYVAPTEIIDRLKQRIDELENKNKELLDEISELKINNEMTNCKMLIMELDLRVSIMNAKHTKI